MLSHVHHPVVCYGETLWDFLPAGKEPGGAPMNVAFHLNKLGKNPAMISRIGNDELGQKLIEVLHERSLETNYIQTDTTLPTSTVVATVKDNHEMVYEIVQNVAWDNIEYEDNLAELVSNADYLVFGSLAARSLPSRNTLFRLIELAKTKVLDINLRPPYYSPEIVESLLKVADIVKLNQAELELISGWYTTLQTDEERIQILQDKFNLKTIIVTKGGDGALLKIDDKIYSHPGFKVTVTDTVGSGDSFLAAIISQLIDGTPHNEILIFANKLGAFITTQKGACPNYKMEQVVSMGL